MIRHLLIALAALLAYGAHAQSQVYGSVGATGLGAGVGFTVAPRLGLRIEANVWRATADVDVTETGRDYAGTARFRHAVALADRSPGGGRVRLITGLAIDRSRLDAVSTTATVTVDGIPDSIKGDQPTLSVRLPGVMPDLGIGFGLHPGPRGWSVFGDLDAHPDRRHAAADCATVTVGSLTRCSAPPPCFEIPSLYERRVSASSPWLALQPSCPAAASLLRPVGSAARW